MGGSELFIPIIYGQIRLVMPNTNTNREKIKEKAKANML